MSKRKSPQKPPIVWVDDRDKELPEDWNDENTPCADGKIYKFTLAKNIENFLENVLDELVGAEMVDSEDGVIATEVMPRIWKLIDDIRAAVCRTPREWYALLRRDNPKLRVRK